MKKFATLCICGCVAVCFGMDKPPELARDVENDQVRELVQTWESIKSSKCADLSTNIMILNEAIRLMEECRAELKLYANYANKDYCIALETAINPIVNGVKLFYQSIKQLREIKETVDQSPKYYNYVDLGELGDEFGDDL